MVRPRSYSLILAAAIVASGCSERAEGPPTEPQFHTVLNKSSSCDVSHIGQLANFFFSPPRKQTVSPLVNLLATQPPHSLAAKNSGFDIMAQMDSALNIDAPTTAGDASVGSDLINHLLLCMYNPTSEAASYPASFPDTFVVPLTKSLTGAFGHRSLGIDPVFARSALFSKGFSGVAPGGTWEDVLNGGLGTPPNNPARVVLYGRPATTTTNNLETVIPLTYDWRTIPHNATFDPSVIVAICIDALAPENATLMLNKQGVAVLAFVDAGFLDPANCSPTNTALLDTPSPLQLARRLVRFGTGLFTPRPLMANVLSPGGLGGSNSRGGTRYGPKSVPTASATLSAVNKRIKVNTERFELLVTAKSGSDLVNGVKFVLSTTVNSGVPTSIRVAVPNTPCSSGVVPEGITGSGTNLAGTYRFTNLCFTNTGNVFIVATGNIQDRNFTPVTVQSNKIIVYP